MAQAKIFTKSNLFYVLLSVTISHILNFVVNSSLSTWQEFPPKFPNSVYASTFFTPLLLFISLTFEPIHTRKRFYTLLLLALIYLSIPLSFRGKYPPLFHNYFVCYGLFSGSKMLLFLKFNRTYLNQKDSDQKKEFKPYLQTLFNWRLNSYIIPPKSESSNEKENPLIIKSPTTSQINKKLFNRFVIFIAKWLIYELFYFISTKHVIEIPEKPYQIRLLEFITKGIPPVTMPLILQCLNFTVIVYLWITFNYELLIIIFTIFLHLFYSTSEKSNHKSILVRLGLLTHSEYVSLNEWIIILLFNTKNIFNEPWMSSSPRDFWVRWQLFFSEIFKEFGYLPARNLFAPFVTKKIASVMGVLGAFGASALFHEYAIIGIYDIWTGEHFFFFIINGVIFILWEAVFGYENKNENTKVKRFLKWVLMAVIYLCVLPAFIEPVRRKPEIPVYPSYFAQYYMN